jgi:hypothetical protein
VKLTADQPSASSPLTYPSKLIGYLPRPKWRKQHINLLGCVRQIYLSRNYILELIYKKSMFQLQNLVKIVLEGLAVALAAYYIPQRKTSLVEVLCIGLTAAAIFSLLDLFSPSIAAGARQGAGFGVGLNSVGWQKGG